MYMMVFSIISREDSIRQRIRIFDFQTCNLYTYGSIPLRKLQTQSTLRQESEVFPRPVLALAHQFLPGIQGLLYESGGCGEDCVEGEV